MQKVVRKKVMKKNNDLDPELLFIIRVAIWVFTAVLVIAVIKATN